VDPTDTEIIANLTRQLQTKERELEMRDMIIWKLETELQAADLGDMVQGARAQVQRLYEDGELENRGYELYTHMTRIHKMLQ
jgi:hypothetical protein